MIEILIWGLPYDRPGGLVLSIIYFLLSGFSAVVLGVIYCFLCANFRMLTWPLQLGTTLLRGVPLLLLVFICAHIPFLSTGLAGFVALTIYSLTHVGEILRGFMGGYPEKAKEQALVMGLSTTVEWVSLRIPWVISKSLPALLTHWVSLLKDSSALLIISIGELATVAKMLSESTRQFSEWANVLLLTALFYFVATLLLIKLVSIVGGRLNATGSLLEQRAAM